LLPSLLMLPVLDQGVWGRAKLEFDRHVAGV
jgi:saccharopine dehydrogenase (NAD+, L-lysine-forming)